MSASAINRPSTDALLNGRPISASSYSMLSEIVGLFRGSRLTPALRKTIIFISATVFVIILNVIGELRMNQWQGAFYRAIEQKNLPEVGYQSLTFLLIMLVLLSFIVSQNWLLEQVKIRLREWLTHSLMDYWMMPGRAYRLNMTSEERLNPDQRIQEDVKNLSELSGDLGLGALRSALLLISFVGVLWMMSRGITLPVGNFHLQVPGYMVWFALIYAGIGSWLAARVGAPLIKLNDERYTREANFRYSIMRITDNAESIAFFSGEKDERRIADSRLLQVLEIVKSLSFANARLTWIACGHGWMVVILPVIVALPGYMQGKLDFGGLMMVVGAFNQVQNSLRWFVENFGRIADWRSALHRVYVFREAVETVDDYEQPETISLIPHPEKILEFEKMSITLLDGQVVIADASARILPGERVLLAGDSGSGKSTLLRAVGGLWPWGSGTILMPPREDIMFLPQRPYIPLGTLAAAIAYPHNARDFDRSALERCLHRVNLESFSEMLELEERWDKLMSLGQQQRLSFARLLLHRPQWVFLDEATSALDDKNQDNLMSIFTKELSGSALLSIAHRTGLEKFHTRTLQLIQMHSGCVLVRKPKPRLQLPEMNTSNWFRGLTGRR